MTTTQEKKIQYHFRSQNYTYFFLYWKIIQNNNCVKAQNNWFYDKAEPTQVFNYDFIWNTFILNLMLHIVIAYKLTDKSI